MDVRGILGMDTDIRNGFSNIKVKYQIDADVSNDGHQGAVAQPPKRSRPCTDIITNTDRRRGRGQPT